mmetsp:Transcript_9872/g.15141  ORF Transcript_9872/g.15141 Transcript_9872/m.15141 type:complete len:90 (-) Transcript_9872:38-307(-)
MLKQQKLVAELEWNKERLEELAIKREELKEASKTVGSSSAFVSTRGGSFILTNNEKVKRLISEQTKDVDQNIREICTSIQAIDAADLRK